LKDVADATIEEVAEKKGSKKGVKSTFDRYLGFYSVFQSTN
jgi:hypothetical protein